MFVLNNQQPQTTPLTLRFNKHFRIKSTSKDKLRIPSDISTVKSCRKDNLQEMKRIFSESRNKKSASLETAIKIKITKQELQRRFEKAERNIKKKNIIYNTVKTDNQVYTNEHRNSNTCTPKNDQNQLSTYKEVKFLNPTSHPSSNQKIEQNSKLSTQPEKFKKIKNDKEPKGKYRCRVNQFVFEHNRKKSTVSKEQQQNLDQFWKNVNESLILAGKQQEEVSKELQQFVEHFVTQ